MEARLKTGLWVQAAIRQANIQNIGLMILRRGDGDAGAVLVKRRLPPAPDLPPGWPGDWTVLVETRDPAGARAWLAGTGPTPVTEPEADAYLARAMARDPDLWVLEIDDRGGRLPFEARIIG